MKARTLSSFPIRKVKQSPWTLNQAASLFFLQVHIALFHDIMSLNLRQLMRKSRSLTIKKFRYATNLFKLILRRRLLKALHLKSRALIIWSNSSMKSYKKILFNSKRLIRAYETHNWCFTPKRTSVEENGFSSMIVVLNHYRLWYATFSYYLLSLRVSSSDDSDHGPIEDTSFIVSAA